MLSDRAAAYSKMNKQEQAIDDCLMALRIDPNYSKAYGRKGSVSISSDVVQEK